MAKDNQKPSAAPQLSQSEAQAWLRKRGFTPSPQTAQIMAAQAAWADAIGDREAIKVYRERLINVGIALAWSTTKSEPRRLGRLNPPETAPQASAPEPVEPPAAASTEPPAQTAPSEGGL